MKRLIFAVAPLALLMMPGCTTIAGLASSLSSSTPTQVTTLAEAEQAATLTTRAVDLYVSTAHPDKAVLIEIKSLSDGTHAALVSLEAANAAGHSLVFSSFNAAKQAFDAYATAKGIKH